MLGLLSSGSRGTCWPLTPHLLPGNAPLRPPAPINGSSASCSPTPGPFHLLFLGHRTASPFLLDITYAAHPWPPLLRSLLCPATVSWLLFFAPCISHTDLNYSSSHAARQWYLSSLSLPPSLMRLIQLPTHSSTSALVPGSRQNRPGDLREMQMLGPHPRPTTGGKLQ